MKFDTDKLSFSRYIINLNSKNKTVHKKNLQKKTENKTKKYCSYLL